MGYTGGSKHKIPEDKWTEIYSMYQSGSTAEEIHRKVINEWHIDVSLRSLYTLIKQLRAVKTDHLSQLIGTDTADALGRYRWLQEQLEEMALASKGDKDIFLKIADRLKSMYEFQMTFTQTLPTNKTNTNNGRDELIKELTSKLTTNATSN